MRRLLRLALPLGLLALALPAGAGAQTTISQGVTRVAALPGTTGVTNSDLAFWGNRMYAGNYSGFRVFDISNPAAPTLLSSVVCTAAPGTAGQGDVSVWGNLLFRSVDTPQTQPDCSRTNTTGGAPGWEGVDIFDVSNPAAPQYIGGVATDCGSHTHTLVPDPRNNRLFLYVSSYPSSGLGTSPFGNQCSRPHNKISVIEVPLGNPAGAHVARTVAMDMPESAIFGGTGLAAGCHDISVLLELNVGAGACLSQGVIFDISDRGNPRVAYRLENPAIDTCARALPAPNNPLCLWHSASFTWDGKYVVFGDEAGGGGGAECSSEDPESRGAFWMHRLSNPTSPISRFKIPRVQPAPTQNCTAHLMNFIPTNLGYIMPSSWYSGGTSVVNWTNTTGTPFEFAWYEVEPPADATTQRTNTWTTYWYNGYLYTQDNGAVTGGNRGVEVLTLDQPWTRSRTWRLTRYNAQTQENVLSCTGSAQAAARLQARRRGTVHVRLRLAGGASVVRNQPIVGARVLARGVGVRASARTDATGMAMLRFTPRRAGTLRIVVPDAPNLRGCEARLRVRAAARRGGGTGGAGLTGRALFR